LALPTVIAERDANDHQRGESEALKSAAAMRQLDNTHFTTPRPSKAGLPAKSCYAFRQTIR
jgi:hypothetical protein